MRKYLLSLFSLFSLSQMSLAQQEVELFSKDLGGCPNFNFGRAEFDTLIRANFVPPFELIFGLEAELKISFKIDSLGHIDSLSISDYHLSNKKLKKEPADTFKVAFKNGCIKEAERVFRLTDGLWYCLNDKGRSTQRLFYIFHADFNSSFRLYKQADGYRVQTFSEKHEALYNIGVRKMVANKLLLAKVYFEQALTYNNVDRDAYYNLGIIFFQLKDDKKACTCWRMAQKFGDQEAGKLLTKYCTN